MKKTFLWLVTGSCVVLCWGMAVVISGSTTASAQYGVRTITATDGEIARAEITLGEQDGVRTVTATAETPFSSEGNAFDESLFDDEPTETTTDPFGMTSETTAPDADPFGFGAGTTTTFNSLFGEADEEEAMEDFAAEEPITEDEENADEILVDEVFVDEPPTDEIVDEAMPFASDIVGAAEEVISDIEGFVTNEVTAFTTEETVVEETATEEPVVDETATETVEQVALTPSQELPVAQMDTVLIDVPDAGPCGSAMRTTSIGEVYNGTNCGNVTYCGNVVYRRNVICGSNVVYGSSTGCVVMNPCFPTYTIRSCAPCVQPVMYRCTPCIRPCFMMVRPGCF